MDVSQTHEHRICVPLAEEEEEAWSTGCALQWGLGQDAAGKDGKRSRERQRIRWFDGISDSMDVSWSKLRETVKDKGSLACCRPWGHKSWTQLSD